MEDSSYFSYILILLTVLAFSVLVILYRNYCRGPRLPARKKLSNTILIVGPSGSGKTTLLYKIAQNRFITTLSSMKENVANVELKLE